MPKLRVLFILAPALFLASGFQLAAAHGMHHNPSRFQYIKRHGIPSAYKGRLNPLRMTAPRLAAGQRLYNANCAACHGRTGKGDGENAKDLNPAPPALTGMYGRPMAGMDHQGPGGHLMHGRMHHHPGMTHAQAMGGLNLDAYGFWSISEGGASMGSSMPAFKDILSEKERWQILLYVANGFSVRAGK